MGTSNSDLTTNVPLAVITTPSTTGTTSALTTLNSQTNTTSTQEVRPNIQARFSVASAGRSQTNASIAPSEHNWFTYALHRYRNLPRYHKIMLTLSLIISTSQIVSITSVVGITAYQSCESLFRFYLIATAVRLLLYTPLIGIYYLHPEGRNTHYSTSIFLSWVNRSRSVLDFFGTMLFLVGNYLIFTTEICSSGSPGLYGLTIALVVLGYLKIIVPIMLCAAILCLPCILIVLRALRIGEVLQTGANEESIDKLRIVRYHKNREESEDQENSSGKKSTEISHVTNASNKNTRPNLFTRILLKIFRRNKSKEIPVNDNVEEGKPEGGSQQVVYLSDEDAVCCICLEEYSDGEKLREMKCIHYFHVHCIDEWLKLNRTCPLCKRDIEFDKSTEETETTESNVNS
ncbi:hypothetical protein K7432_000142 [Basidiobolus ranarum]|uniref:RING-type domain-containing protein n=1 Tax=Basidiobolus ranarum TaxID=34480 RepID=A0ABR2WBM3_9FUNG